MGILDFFVCPIEVAVSFPLYARWGSWRSDTRTCNQGKIDEFPPFRPERYMCYQRLVFFVRFQGFLSGKKKAHKHKQFFPVIARIRGGGLPTGWPGVKRLCAVCRTKET